MTPSEVSANLSPMPITTIAPWFGGKRTLSPRIIAELGPHRCYWEPFCGGISVILNKAPTTMETINDLHGDLINLARVIQDEQLAPKLYRKLRRTLMHEDFLHEAAERWKKRGIQPATQTADFDRAYDYFLCCWCGRNGVAGTMSYNQGFCVRYTANGGHAAKRFLSAVSSIPAWRKRLASVTILNRDGFELLGRIEDAPSTAIYLDPPYITKGAKYTHDFANIDHKRLRDCLSRFKHARIVVSYYDHPLLHELYQGWTFVDCAMSKSLANQFRGARAKKAESTAPEVLIVNGHSHTQVWSESASQRGNT